MSKQILWYIWLIEGGLLVIELFIFICRHALVQVVCDRKRQLQTCTYRLIIWCDRVGQQQHPQSLQGGQEAFHLRRLHLYPPPPWPTHVYYQGGEKWNSFQNFYLLRACRKRSSRQSWQLIDLDSVGQVSKSAGDVQQVVRRVSEAQSQAGSHRMIL